MINAGIKIFSSFILLLLGAEQSAQANTENNEIRIAIRAHSSEKQDTQKWAPTIEYLNRVLPQHRFVMQLYTSIKQQLADAKANRFHFLLANPATYVELEVSTGAKAILTLINNRRGSAQTRFGSVIFTHAEQTDILEIKDLKGKDFLAVSPLGFGGWRIGLKVLQDHGIDPEADFTSLNYTGSQPAVVAAIMNKQAHAGMVRTDMLERLADKGKLDLRAVRILEQQSTAGFPFFHSTRLYPEWPFAVMPGTSTKLTEQVKQALLKIEATDSAARAGKYIGWAPALDYQPVKDLLRDIGVAPFTKTRPEIFVFFFILSLSVLFVVFYALKYYSNINKSAA